MSEFNPLPVDVEGTVTLAGDRPSLVQLIAVVALALGLLLCLGGVIAGMLQGTSTPPVLDVTLGAIAGALSTLLIGSRGR